MLRSSLVQGPLDDYSTRAEPLSFRANKDLAFSHCTRTVGRKSGDTFLAVEHYASWHPKKTIIRVHLFWARQILNRLKSQGLGSSSCLSCTNFPRL